MSDGIKAEQATHDAPTDEELALLAGGSGDTPIEIDSTTSR